MNTISWDNPCPADGDSIQEGHLGGAKVGGAPASWFPELWDWLIKTWDLRSVLSVGCGCAYDVKFFQDMALTADGVDGAEGCVKNAVTKITQHDFTIGPYLPRRYDMVYSTEFVEHVEERFVGNILASLCLADKVICLGAAFDPSGYHHVNCQKAPYWINRIEMLGYHYKHELTLKARSLTEAGKYGRHVSNFFTNGLIFTKCK